LLSDVVFEGLYDGEASLTALCHAFSTRLQLRRANPECGGSFGSSKFGRGLATKLHPRFIALGYQWSGRFGSSKFGRGLATKLHPHLIALGGGR